MLNKTITLGILFLLTTSTSFEAYADKIKIEGSASNPNTLYDKKKKPGHSRSDFGYGREITTYENGKVIEFKKESKKPGRGTVVYTGADAEAKVQKNLDKRTKAEESAKKHHDQAVKHGWGKGRYLSDPRVDQIMDRHHREESIALHKKATKQRVQQGILKQAKQVKAFREYRQKIGQHKK